MYTEEQYLKAKAALDDPQLESKVGADRMGRWAERIAEYEAAQAQPVAEAQVDHGFEQPSSIADFQNVPDDPTTDGNLPNASKKKKYASPPEYVSKSQSALGLIAKSSLIDPLNGPSVTMHFEPSEEQFLADMEPLLRAKGIQPGSGDYKMALDEYRDAKWEQAYKSAEAEDRPLVRSEYIGMKANVTNWDKLSAWLGDKADTASSFAKGLASGGTLGLTRALETDADREQRARTPGATVIGGLAGAINPGSLVSRLTSAAGKLGKGAGLGRYGAASLAGGATGVAEVAGHQIGDELSDKLHGRPIDQKARSNLTGRLVGGALLGGGAGALGEGIASLAQRYRSGIREATSDIGPELTNAEASGTTTDLIRGLKPSSDVEAMLQKARGPVPGEAKLAPSGSAVEYAARDVRSPIVAQQVDEHAAALKRMEAESGGMYARDPGLKKGHGMHETGKTLLKTVLDRSQPEAAGKFLPAADDALGATNNAQFTDFVRKLYKPRLVGDVDAAAEAARTGGHVVTLEEAQRAGFKVKGLSGELNPETGLPHNAPPLSEYDRVSAKELLPATDDTVRATKVDNERATMVDDGMLEAPKPSPIGPTPANDAHGVVFGAGAQNDARQSPTMARIISGGGQPANSFAEIDPALQKAIGGSGLSAANDISVPVGYNPKNFRVVLEPRPYDALKMEQQIQAIDRAGKAGTDAKVDPAWPELMRAARVDREQFGKAWSGLKNVHHEELTALEQRGAHAGITENKPYQSMSGNAQKAANAAITNYGVAPQATNEALSELADNAGVRGGLETLKGTRAYSALKEKASPQAGMTEGGGFLRVGGLMPAVKLRADAFARGLARGPDGLPLFTAPGSTAASPALANEPLGRSLLPSSGLLSMGRGALSVKTGSVYDSATGRAKPAGTLTQQEREQLERLLAP